MTLLIQSKVCLAPNDNAYAGYREMPQKVCERCIFHVRPYAFYFEMPRNQRLSFSVHFSFSNKLRVFSLKCSDFLCSKKKHATTLKMKNEPKIKVFDFGAFQNKMHMASREKYIFHILFGAFHGTPRIITYIF